jgi:hypothetical protein
VTKNQTGVPSVRSAVRFQSQDGADPTWLRSDSPHQLPASFLYYFLKSRQEIARILLDANFVYTAGFDVLAVVFVTIPVT